jgi:hypothetical protein
MRLGSSSTSSTSASSRANRDLRKLVASGGFRADLFFRLNSITMTLPPLRNRRTTCCRWPGVPRRAARKLKPRRASATGEEARPSILAGASGSCGTSSSARWCSAGAMSEARAPPPGGSSYPRRAPVTDDPAAGPTRGQAGHLAAAAAPVAPGSRERSRSSSGRRSSGPGGPAKPDPGGEALGIARRTLIKEDDPSASATPGRHRTRRARRHVALTQACNSPNLVGSAFTKAKSPRRPIRDHRRDDS